MKFMMNRRDFCFSMTGLGALASTGRVPFAEAEPWPGGVESGVSGETAALGRNDIPRSWRRAGIVLQRSLEGPGSSVIGDPCIVRDDDIDGWRMFLFFDPPGCGQAICPQKLDAEPGHWKMEGPLVFTNPQDILGGFAFCDEEWPVCGWQWLPDPIERIEDIPPQAAALGEGTNLWRQHILALPDGNMALYCNSGFYGKEQLFMKIAGK
jgi:hypothetical protein